MANNQYLAFRCQGTEQHETSTKFRSNLLTIPMRNIILMILYYSFFFLNEVKGQEGRFNNVNENEVICYCSVNQSTPESILNLDNNWSLVLQLRQAKTISQLDSLGIKYTKSQLKLLQQWSIISKNENSVYKTSINLFDSIKTRQLRDYSKELSQKLIPQIIPDIENLKLDLQKINREKNTYTILFSYILDGKVWDDLKNKKFIPKNEITIDNPFWKGEFWTLYPKRDFSCGTNSISDSGYSIKVNWSENIIPKMIPFVSRFDLQGKILADLISKGKVENEEAKIIFAPYNFFDRNGNFTVPIIKEEDNNTTYKIAQTISGKVISFIETQVDSVKLKKTFGFNSNSQAIIILYHEMMWDMLNILEQQGIISRPLAFKDLNKVKPEDISDLIIIIKK